MFVKCFNPNNYECFDVLTKIKSMQWTKRFYDVGSFEMHLKKASLKPNDIITHKNNSGIVMQVIETFDGVAVYGYDLKGITTFRHITEPLTTTSNEETIIKNYADRFLNTTDRKVFNFNIKPNLSRGKSLTWESDNINLAEDLKMLCEQGQVGYDITFNEEQKKIYFDITVPQDKSDSVIFSRNFRNVENLEYVRDNFNTINFAYAKNEEEQIITKGTTTGIFRREGMGEDLDKTLSEKKEIETLRGKANDKLVYGVDWNLGDYVTVIFKDLTEKKQITSVLEVYEPLNTTIIPVFGDEKENVIKKVLKG